ncbi:probable ubiquinol-cytochrome c reductase complex 11 kda protein [Melanopsichium pennsylvanicum]|uniref:Cytochrome b-c1 complex subunit 8 n=1 Tax=Melanopsichium pennsylvanicum TaxID=63383 RepID=A0AAJ5C6G6_9BASI|nr:probable ubiquinol-cytochrome c reductase complex 11 kda protein [Melanopsichium pennsylvanicum]
MRASQVSFSGMPTGKKYNAMKGALHSYIFYGFKRIMQQAPYFAVPFAAGYGLIAWAKSKNAYYNSKAGHLEHGHDE